MNIDGNSSIQNQEIEEFDFTSRVIKTETIRWKELVFLQDDSFKEWIERGDEKLLNSLLKFQFVDPFKVWENEGVLYCLDGKHRYLDLIKVEESGVKVPEMLPATFIRCIDQHEAAELVFVYSSTYARITQQGMFDFVSKFEIDLPALQDSISIPDFSFDRFEQKFDVYGINDGAMDDDFGYSDESDVLVKEGDIFQLNGHRIICGSFKEKTDVEALMKGDKARIVNCDPPYNLPTNFFLKENPNKHGNFAMGAGEMTDEEFAQFLQLIMQTSVDNTVPGSIHYLFMDFRHSWHMCEAARRVYGSPEPKQTCVWVKDIMANGSFYRAQQELCFIFSNEAEKHVWNNDFLDENGFYKNDNELCFIFKSDEKAKHLSHLALKDRIRTNVWKYPSAISRANPDWDQLKNHPTPKPVAMIADAILDTTNEGDIVIDWFLGSGTCLIACEKTKRNGRFTEIAPKYVQTAIIRYLVYCKRRGIDVSFTHENGGLTVQSFQDFVAVEL